VSKGTLGVRQVSNASTIITIPSSWQTSIISGDGGLCEVRNALTPMLFMIFICRMSASRLTAEPRAPSSWCRSTPWTFRYLPLRKKPSLGSIRNQRMPKGVSTLSTTRWPTRSFVRSVYR
jgi:hypothetical protein